MSGAQEHNMYDVMSCLLHEFFNRSELESSSYRKSVPKEHLEKTLFRLQRKSSVCCPFFQKVSYTLGTTIQQGCHPFIIKTLKTIDH